MLVGCLWHNDHLVTVSLGGRMSVFSASDPGKTPISFYGHLKSIGALASFVHNGQKVILSSSYDGVIVRWMQGIGYCGKLERKDHTQIKCFVAAEDEILTSGFDNKVWRLPLNGDNCGDAVPVDVGSQPKDLSVAPHSPEVALVSTDSGIVMLHGSKVASAIPLEFAVTASAISPDGNEAVVGAQDGKLRVYCVSGYALTQERVLEKHRGAITVLRYSPDGSMLASVDANREAVVWDRATWEVKLKNMLYHSARINCVAWSPGNKLVATGSLDTCVIVYEVDKPASTRTTIKGAHLGGVYGLVFCGDDRIASAGEDACLRVWRISPQ